MRRHAKASSAAATHGIGSSRGLFGRSFATRGLSRESKGSGAPSHGRHLAALLAVALLIFAFGVSTAAAKSVSNFFGYTSSGATAGLFNTPRGVAVNNTSGDVYVVDSANNRVVRLDASGNFVSAFGQDVVASGADDAGTGFEICKASSSPQDICKAGITTAATGGAMSAPQGIAVDQSSGNLYVTDQGFLRVDVFSSSGAFVRAMGQDVVATGSPGNATVQSAVQTLTVTATGGKFTLSFQGQTTGELAYNAPATGAGSVQTALQGLSTIGSGNATVTSAVAGTYVITFAGSLANSPQPTIAAASAGGEPLTGGTASVASTTSGASGFEICVAANSDVCQTGVTGATRGAFATTFAGYPAVAPTGSANAGNLLVADPGNRRVQEFSSTGTFVRAFGFDVAKAGPGNTGSGFEICSAANFDVCQVAAASGSGAGQFGTGGPLRVAEDSAGAIYTVESASPNFRVQRFTPAGPSLTPDLATFAAANGSSATDTPTDVAVNPVSGNVFVTKATAAGATPSCTFTGAASVAERRVLEFGSGGTLQLTHMACAGINSANGLAFNPANGRLFVSSTAPGHGVFVLDNVNPPSASINAASGVGANTATFSGKVNPQGSATSYRFEYSSDGGSTWSKDSLLDAGSGVANVTVTDPHTDLLPSTAYLVRLVATKPFGAGAVTTAPVGFTTSAAAPAVRLGTTVRSDSALTAATLGAIVNPRGQATTYRFEYGKTAAYGTAVPAVAASAGSGTADVPVSQSITGLDLEATYHYRLVATNATGTTNGPDLTFDTGPGLGAGMHYEMASPVNTNGSITGPVSLSPDGNRINIETGKQAFGDAQSQHGELDYYLSTRTPTGWVTNSMNPPASPNNFLTRTEDVSPDLGTYLAVSQTYRQYENGASQMKMMRLGDLNFQTLPEIRDLSGFTKEATKAYNSYLGASDDLNHMVVQATPQQRFLPTDPVDGSKGATVFSLYEISASPFSMRRVTLDNSGNDLAPVCYSLDRGAYRDPGFTPISTNLVSADGSKIFFSVKPGVSPTTDCSAVSARLYARIDGTHTVEISASECHRVDCSTVRSDTIFTGASNDGMRVTFGTTEQLVDADTDTTKDLYLYDFAKPAGQRLSLITAGDGTDATPGSGAQAVNVTQISQDGSRVYFVAGGVLTAGANCFGQRAQSGANNLYLYEPDTGRTTFVSRFEASDVAMWRGFGSQNQLSDASGRYLIMSVLTKVAPDDTDAATDIYRYDAQTGKIIKISPGNSANSVKDVSSSLTGYTQPQYLLTSADGSTIAFATQAPLQANDTNGAFDAYVWKEGSVSLVSGGDFERGMYTNLGLRVSSSGNEVAFATAAQLVPKDVTTTVSTYVARTGDDVEQPLVTPPAPCASSELCRSTPQPPADVAPATPGFSGPGNEPAPKPKPKHHKKKHHKKKQKNHRAHKHTTRHAG